MSADEMIACLGSCRARSEIAAMIKALSLDPSLNTPVEAKRLEAARAAMANWKAQPRLPSPAQCAPVAPQPPLNRIWEQRARRRGSGVSR